MPRFVLLYHDCLPGYHRLSHWDLMFETGGVLRTWAIAELPREWHAAQALTARLYPHCAACGDSREVVAEQLGDHRREYLDYEGPLSDDRGFVVRVAAGTYSFDSESTTACRLTLVGDTFEGRIDLCRPTSADANWVLTCATNP